MILFVDKNDGKDTFNPKATKSYSLKNLSKSYKAKLLLFGEYTVTLGGSALAVPLPHFSGKWQIGHYSKPYAEKLLDFAVYVAAMENRGFSKKELKAFEQMLHEGLQFKSEIPEGYGLGSSGALVAGFYDTFFTVKQDLQLSELKALLGRMESFFHGKSSGIDPLVSYLDQTVFTRGEDVMVSDTEPLSNPELKYFLIDTGIQRSTSHWVNIFREKMAKDPSFHEAIRRLEKINESIIDALRNNNSKELYAKFRQISEIQYRAFFDFIPEEFRELWKKGINTDRYHLKLCGAGGGGMLLGLTRELEGIKELTFHFDIVQI